MNKTMAYLILPVVFCALTSNIGYAEFVRGADISTQTQQDSDGVKYNEEGVQKEVLTIFKNYDLNWIRIRLFHTPSGSVQGVFQDLAYVTTLAQRVKAEGFKFLLDIHYSDTWADPGHQDIPAAWSSYTHAQLVTAVYDYTRDVIIHLRTHGVMPEMVQIGNEITSGMLWPDGQLYGGSYSWSNFVELINAGILGVNDGRGTEAMPKIMLHIDRGGDWSGTQWFLDNIISRGVVFDVLGQSFYPEWHGTLDDLETCLNNTANNYPYEIMMAEVGDYYTGSTGGTPESQKAFLEGVFQRVQAAPNGRGTGVFYWEPTWVWNSGSGYRALFEPIAGNWKNVNMLMAMEAFDIPGTDVIAPQAPAGLSATAGPSMVSLNWNDNTEEDMEGYNVYRSTTAGGGYTRLNGSLLSSSNYTDNTVFGSMTYYYVVTAVDMSSNESDNSSEVSAVPAGQGTGAILCQWWTGIPGTTVGDLTSHVNYPDNPDRQELLVSLQGPTNWQDNYGTRIRGYLNPVISGDYIFTLASDADSQLWLSSDQTQANARLIASLPANPQSSAVTLAAGQKYYIEILHKEGTGGDSLSVFWQGVGLTQQVIDGAYLSPCCLDLENYADFAGQWNRTDCDSTNAWCGGSDRNRDGKVLLEDLLAFTEAWLLGI